MNKQAELEKVNQEIIQCKICPLAKSGVPVVGEGNPDADIAFIGEAPGKQEAVVGRPFIGRSGQLLRSLIREIGLKEEDVYITSPVKYLPDRGTPTREDIAHGRIHLFKQLDVIQPKFIVLLGNTAVQAVLQEKLPIMKVRGTVREVGGRRYFITLHPAAALRNPPTRKYLLEDFQKVKALLKEMLGVRT